MTPKANNNAERAIFLKSIINNGFIGALFEQHLARRLILCWDDKRQLLSKKSQVNVVKLTFNLHVRFKNPIPSMGFLKSNF